MPSDTELYRDVLHGLLCLLFVIVLMSVPHGHRKRSPTACSRVLGVAGILAAIIYCGVVWADAATICCLIFFFVASIELGQPIGFGMGSPDPDVVGRFHSFSLFVFRATGLVLASVALTWMMACQWTRGVWHRLVWGALLTATLAILMYSSVWMYTRSIRLLSYPLAENIIFTPVRFWIPALVLLFVFITAASYRLAQTPNPSSVGATLEWRRRAYYHEHPAVLSLLAVTLIVGAFPFRYLIPWTYGGVLTFFWELFGNSRGGLQMAVLILAVQGVWFGCRRSSLTPPVGPPELAPGRFAAAWVALFLTTASGLPILAWVGFSLRLDHWLLCPWP